jgi:hypothetical protein
MFGATGGGDWSCWVLNDAVQQVSQRCQIIHGCYNAGAHYRFGGYPSISEHGCHVRSCMRKSQGCERSSHRYIELSITHSFWHVIWVCYERLIRFFGHRGNLQFVLKGDPQMAGRTCQIYNRQSLYHMIFI